MQKSKSVLLWGQMAFKDRNLGVLNFYDFWGKKDYLFPHFM
jgi:hypothetical protein